jgi:hypothetical protein
MWAWANDAIPADARRGLEDVRRFGVPTTSRSSSRLSGPVVEQSTDFGYVANDPQHN